MPTRSVSRRARVAPLAALALLVACARGTATDAVGVAVRSGPTGWATKAVVAKRAPETLLARDGTICRVAPDRYRGTAVGAQVHCNWQ